MTSDPPTDHPRANRRNGLSGDDGTDRARTAVPEAETTVPEADPRPTTGNSPAATRTSRRRFLAAAGATAIASAVAGCYFNVSSSSSTGYGGRLAAVDPGDGSELWRKDVGGVSGGPIAADGTLYTGSEGALHALSPGDGTEQWAAEFGGDEPPAALTPTVVGDTVLVPVGTDLVGLSASDGSEQWRFDAGDAEVWSGPTVAGDVAVVGAGDAHLYGVSVADGSQQWHFTGEQLVAGSETVASGTVYLNSLAGRVHAISLADGSEQWTFETEKAASGGPAVGNGTVYVGTKKRQLYALAASDGTHKWDVDTSGGALNISSGSPQPRFVDGYVYVVAGTVLHGIDADTRETWGEAVHGGFDIDVAGDSVYVGANLSDTGPEGQTDDFGQVYSYDRTSGSERWATYLDGESIGAPTAGSDTVYAGQETGKVFALARSDGSKRWVYEGDRAVRGAPVVTDDAIVVETA